jgi:hypothetical protein
METATDAAVLPLRNRASERKRSNAAHPVGSALPTSKGRTSSLSNVGSSSPAFTSSTSGAGRSVVCGADEAAVVDCVRRRAMVVDGTVVVPTSGRTADGRPTLTVVVVASAVAVAVGAACEPSEGTPVLTGSGPPQATTTITRATMPAVRDTHP